MYVGNKQANEATENGHVIKFLSHADEPRDKYDVYLHSAAKPDNSLSNPRNIFDDSNIEDRKWFRTAKNYLSRAR